MEMIENKPTTKNKQKQQTATTNKSKYLQLEHLLWTMVMELAIEMVTKMVMDAAMVQLRFLVSVMVSYQWVHLLLVRWWEHLSLENSWAQLWVHSLDEAVCRKVVR